MTVKRYITNTKDTCWTDCLACMLEIDPKKVPKFVKQYGNAYMDETRRWLAENFSKGIAYIPSRCFMETCKMRNNPPIGPAGFSIAHLSMVDERSMHVAIAFNGGILWDNGDSREDEYGTIQGYFILYDLEPPKAKWVKKHKIFRKKRKVTKSSSRRRN